MTKPTAQALRAGDQVEASGGCGYTGYEFGAAYPDSTCIDGYLWDLDSCDEPGGGLTQGGDLPCPQCNPEDAPAQQDSQQGAGGAALDICRDAMTADELIACAKANAAQMHPLNNMRDLLEQMSTALSHLPSGHTGGPVAWGYAVRRKAFHDGLETPDAPWHLEFDSTSLKMATSDPDHWEVKPLYAARPAALQSAHPASDTTACLNAAEQKAQAERCGCRGSDDYCPCQNAPDRQTITERGDA